MFHYMILIGGYLLGILSEGINFSYTGNSHDPRISYPGVNLNLGGILDPHIGGIKSFGRFQYGVLFRQNSLLSCRVWNEMVIHVGVSEPLDFSVAIFPGFWFLTLSGRIFRCGFCGIVFYSGVLMHII